MRFFFLVLLVCFQGISFGQTDHFLSNNEKAYLYHVVMKSPTLKRNVGYAFDYSGPVNDKDPEDFLFVEEQILKEPHLLRIDFEEFKYQSTGVVGEMAAKLALWTLYNDLKQGVASPEEATPLFNDFCSALASKLPSQYVNSGKPGKKIMPLLHPNLTYNERTNTIIKWNIFAPEGEKIMNAIHQTIGDFTQSKAKDMYMAFGMKTPMAENQLLAAGDGGGTAGLLGEVDKSNKTKKGEPKGVGLFTYHTEIKPKDKTEWVYASSEPFLEHKKKLSGPLNVHLSIWGFNYSVQTTVVVKRAGKVYLLYGSLYSGELSPDPSHNNDEKTYKDHLEQLEKTDIPELKEELFGGEGIEEKIKRWEKEKPELTVDIQKNEYKISKLRKNQRKNMKKIKAQGNILYAQHGRLKELNKNIKEAKEVFYNGKIALDLMRDRAVKMKENLEGLEQPYTLKNHLVYEFEDGTLFDVKTQDLVFQSSSDKVKVQLLAIGSKPLSKQVDEVQLNVSFTKVSTQYEPVESLELDLRDAFSSDSYYLNELNFNDEAIYLMDKMVNYVGAKKLNIASGLMGEGIGAKRGETVVYEANQSGVTLEAYPGKTKEERAKSKAEMADLRISMAAVVLKEGELKFTINSFTDPVASNIGERSELAKNLLAKDTNLTANLVLSGLRTMSLYKTLIKTMKKRIDVVFPHKAQKEQKAYCEKELDKALQKSSVLVGATRITYKAYEQYSQ